MTKFTDESALADADGWSRWIMPVEAGYKLACCDCGLVHVLEFRVADGRAEYRIRRDNRSTAQMRRHMRAA